MNCSGTLVISASFIEREKEERERLSWEYLRTRRESVEQCGKQIKRWKRKIEEERQTLTRSVRSLDSSPPLQSSFPSTVQSKPLQFWESRALCLSTDPPPDPGFRRSLRLLRAQGSCRTEGSVEKRPGLLAWPWGWCRRRAARVSVFSRGKEW